MSSKPTNYSPQVWDASKTYQKNDIVNGVPSSPNLSYFYSTLDGANLNQNPLNNWTLSTSSYSRSDGLVTLNASSSISPTLSKGSYVVITGGSGLNYTGYLIDGGPNWAKYANVGVDQTGVSSASISSDLNPAWTSGFGWIPSYGTNLDTNFSKITASFGDGYSQRMRNGINTNKSTKSLVFENVTSREVVAIDNYIQDKGGVDPIRINLGDGILGQNTSVKYTLDEPKISTKSYNVNTLTVNATQVFDV
jgi:phage-related protein